MLSLMEICSDLVSADDDLGDGRESTLALLSRFSGELGGSMASLLGTGVDNLVEDFAALGRALALVVSLRQVEGLGVESLETLDSGDEAGPFVGVVFWKKEKMDFCLLDEAEGVVAGLVAFGVRAAALFSPAMMLVFDG